MAKRIAGGLAAMGFTIVSGLAMGIDAVVHAETRRCGGKTAAFLGCGVERAYPASNRRLMDDIIENGAVYSEYPPGCEPMPHNFPQRNRLISGMSLATVVIEAGARSCSLITAGFAGEQGRDIFAVPGNVTSPQSQGSNALIRDGAALVTSAEDILFALNPFLADVEPEISAVAEAGVDLASLDRPSRSIACFLRDHGPHDIDAITLQCGLSAGEAATAAIMLELKGVIRREQGGLYFSATP
jgi:DNA processing protein